MSRTRRRRRPSPPFSPGYWNALVDAAFHPLFATSKSFIVIDGIAHGLVEKNPPLSIKKFIRYSVPELMKPRKNRRTMLGGRRRRYNCRIPVSNRHMLCGYKRAGPLCLGRGVGRAKCPRLIISYERTPL